jgi:antagonist of KipI
MRISIKNPGLLSTLQDLGRFGYLSEAVPFSGAVDRISAIRANLALGNDRNAALIEFTYGGSEFITEMPIIMAYTGKGAVLRAGNIQIPDSRPVFIPEGTQIRLINMDKGLRTYVSVLGGWDIPLVLNSRSTYLLGGFGGFKGRALSRGDVLENIPRYSPSQEILWKGLKSGKINYSKWSLPELNQDQEKTMIRVILGHESTWFDQESIEGFFRVGFQVGRDSNRMGIRLEGMKMNKIHSGELISTGVVPGTLQISGEGMPILLLADAQTTGGYPRLAQVITVDLPRCAQLKPLDPVFFRLIDPKEAERLYFDQEKNLYRLEKAVENKLLEKN